MIRHNGRSFSPVLWLLFSSSHQRCLKNSTHGDKFEGYRHLSNISALKPSEQQMSLRSLVDEDWTRTLTYGLHIAEDADLKTVQHAMEAHLRSRRNLMSNHREFSLRHKE